MSIIVVLQLYCSSTICGFIFLGLDLHLYVDDLVKSAWICLIIGYSLYFLLTYSQCYLDMFTLKSQFWKTLFDNFPQFHRNIFHGLAFASCLFVWRGFWIIFDNYVYIYDEYHKTYVLIGLMSFVFLSLIQGLSGMNGPLSTMRDRYRLFPVYPFISLCM